MSLICRGAHIQSDPVIKGLIWARFSTLRVDNAFTPWGKCFLSGRTQNRLESVWTAGHLVHLVKVSCVMSMGGIGRGGGARGCYSTSKKAHSTPKKYSANFSFFICPQINKSLLKCDIIWSSLATLVTIYRQIQRKTNASLQRDNVKIPRIKPRPCIFRSLGLCHIYDYNSRLNSMWNFDGLRWRRHTFPIKENMKN